MMTVAEYDLTIRILEGHKERVSRREAAYLRNTGAEPVAGDYLKGVQRVIDTLTAEREEAAKR